MEETSVEEYRISKSSSSIDLYTPTISNDRYGVNECNPSSKESMFLAQISYIIASPSFSGSLPSINEIGYISVSSYSKNPEKNIPFS